MSADDSLRPWPRRLLTPEAWRALAEQPGLTLIALWADAGHAHALFHDGTAPIPAAVAVTDGAYPALSPTHPLARWFERMVRDLWGYQAEGGFDERPWLDHGRWAVHAPLASRPAPAGGAPEPPDFLPGPRDGLHQIGRGPVSADPFAPLHLRLHLDGDVIAAVEPRGGYAHRGALALMRGQPPRGAARFAARLAGDSTVAHSVAFAHAVEAALKSEPPPRAAALREAMAALERIAGRLATRHLAAEAEGARRRAGSIARTRERLLEAIAAAFGSRTMMDGIMPGGVAANPADTRPLADMVRALGTAPDADEAEDRRALADMLAALPEGPVSIVLPPATGEGIGMAHGPRGAYWHWVRIEGGIVTAAFACDPGWANLAAVAAGLPGTTLAHANRLLCASGVSAPGMDL